MVKKVVDQTDLVVEKPKRSKKVVKKVDSEDDSGSEGLSKVQIKTRKPKNLKETVVSESVSEPSLEVESVVEVEPVVAKKSRKPRESKPKEVKAKRPLNKWTQALMEYNKGKETYHIPKKGTTEYDEVRILMDQL
jgi:hypothetical protein